MINFNDNILCVLDVETTGREPEFHEICQLALVPLDPTTLDPHPQMKPFVRTVRPEYQNRIEKEAMRVHGIPMDVLSQSPNQEQTIEDFRLWFEALGLGLNKRLIPLCQNSPFDIGFMKHWLGIEQYAEIFSHRGRDTMHLAASINDCRSYAGEPVPFKWLGLKELADHFGIPLVGHHDALADCLVTAKIYRELLKMMAN